MGAVQASAATLPVVSPPRVMRLTYATRRSALALAQCRAFVSRLSLKALSTGSSGSSGGNGLAALGAIEAEELQVVTSGDRIQDRPLAEIGGKGLFVKEIEDALLERRADFAVHSIKDVPGVLPRGLVIACVPRREDARDVLVAPRYRTLDALPRGARVGTSSLRRAVALLRLRPDLTIAPLRGNVDTRLGKVDAGEYEAIVLARAGLTRLGLEGRATEILAKEVSLPAVGQGALGIECRSDDTALRDLLELLHDEETAACVASERGVLVALGGDCRTPLGAHAERVGELMRLRAFVAHEDGSGFRAAERVAPWPRTAAFAQEMGETLGASLR
jgi:hydroxymethylbilane synthase